MHQWIFLYQRQSVTEIPFSVFAFKLVLLTIGSLNISVIQNLSGGSAELLYVLLAKLGALLKFFRCQLTLLCNGGKLVDSLKF